MTNVDLNLASNMFGSLSGTVRARLVALLNSPNTETWDDAYTIILDQPSWTTLWQAVIAVDPSFPRTGPVENDKGNRISGWARIPDRETVIQAINYATH
jgi:hypothetical protein